MYKKAWCICRVVVLLTKLIAFWRCRRRHFFVRSLLSKEGWRVLLLWCFFQFLRDLDDEITAIKLEEESLKRKMNGKKELQSWTKVRGTVLQYFFFLSFLGSLLKQCILFDTFLQFSLPAPYPKLKLGKKFCIHASNIVCGVRNIPETQKCPKTFVHDCSILKY